jgi:CRISPR/Cas system-associated endoribonuclease Cas2
MAQFEPEDKSGLAMDKEQVQAVDNGVFRGNLDTDDETVLAQYDIPDDERRQLLRKLDSRIAPMVMILYLIAFLDRSESE